MLRRDGRISDWYDREIKTGGAIDREISAQLDDCQLFLALVSPDFLNSGYCYDKEMKRAIERHEAGELTIVPIILEPSNWQTSPLKQFKAVPKDGKPISEWANQNNRLPGCRYGTASAGNFRDRRGAARSADAPGKSSPANAGEVSPETILRRDR